MLSIYKIDFYYNNTDSINCCSSLAACGGVSNANALPQQAGAVNFLVELNQAKVLHYRVGQVCSETRDEGRRERERERE